MKVALIDTSGDAYGTGLASALAKNTDLVYITKKNDTDKSGILAIKKYWFKEYGTTTFGKILKGINYLISYSRLFFLIKLKKIDVVHIEWLQIPTIDYFLLKMLKTTGVRIVFTAHNVLPHRNSQDFIEKYRKIYSVCDRIIIHGKTIKNEFLNYFPEYESKVRIEKHGQYIGKSSECSCDNIENALVEKMQQSIKVALFFGNIFYNKGVDRLIPHWLTEFQNSKYLFVIVGKKDSNYQELNELEKAISESDNMYYKPQIIEEKELNYYISNSDLIVMPYRHASMSGIIFKAAEMKKTILTTDVGAIGEYIDNECGYIVDNNDRALIDTFDYVMREANKDELYKKGINLANKIETEYSWDSIAPKTIADAYVG